MRNNYLRSFLVAMALFCCCSLQAVQLSGSYSIDSLSAPSTTNFRNFASAVTFLTSSGSRTDGGPSNNAPFGVSGSVVFNVAAGIYPITSSISIDSIIGVSPANTVLFTGGTGNASTRIISGSLNAALIKLNGCKYVTLRELTVTNNFAGVCAGITIVGGAVTNKGTGCAVKNCIINIPNSGTGNSWGINVSADANGIANTATRVDSLRIDSNTITGGFYGINFVGATDTLRNFDNKFRYNNVSNAYNTGIRIATVNNAIDIVNNTVTMNKDYNSSIAISVETHRMAVNATTASSITGNKAAGAGRALSVTAYATYLGYPIKIYNNMLTCYGDNTLSGMYLSSFTANIGTVDCFHNTVYTKNTENYTLYYNGSGTGSTFKNNIFIAASLTGYAAQFVNSPAGNVINGNIYYNTSGGNLIKRGPTDYNSLNYQTAAAGGDSSFNYLPAFISVANNNLHIKDGCSARGINLTAILPLDIDGQTRSSYPNIGCDEFTNINNNLAIDALLFPAFPITSGVQNVSVRVKNTGANVISTGNISFQLNGGTVTTEPWSGSLDACDVTTFNFGATATFITGKNTLKVFTSLPNGIADADMTNDTITTIFYPSLNGNYTIGGGGADFNTFADATIALKNSGVAGPVTFTVNAGVYNEQIIVDGLINGASTVNTITFNGVNNSACTITGALASKAVVIINQSKYVTFKNFTVNNTITASGGSGIAIIGNIANDNGSSCTISNCIVNISSTAGLPSYAITVTSSENGFGAYITRTDSIRIDSNIINGSYYGISFYGAGAVAYNRDHKIRNNTVTNAYFYGINLNRNFNAIDVLYNTVTMNSAAPASVASIGLFHQTNTVSSTAPSHRIIGNKVLNANSAGMQVQSPGGTVSNPTKFHNNMVGGVMRASTNYGIYITSGGVVEYLHNTTNIGPGSLGGTIYGLSFNGTAAGNLFVNNIFAVTSGSGTTVYPAYFQTNPTGNVVDYNQYYNSVTTVALLRGSAFDYTNLKTAAAGGLSSIYGLPNFLSTTNNFHIIDRCSPTGTNLTGIVPLDVDGEPRNSTPQLGCDEYQGLSDEVAIDKIVNPASPITTGAVQDVIVRVKNKGNNIITSLNVSYSVNGGSIHTQLWNGTLNPCAVADVVFTGADQITLSGSNAMLVFTDSPNGAVDPTPANDTLRATYLQAINAGTYTIGTGGTYTTFAAACNALSTQGILGSVTFNVLTGSYTEQVSLNGPIAGTSATSTITFDGIDSSTRILSANAPSAPVFKINKASNVIIKNLTVRNLATAACTGISLVGGNTTQDGTGFTVKRCSVKFPNATAGTQNVYGILVTGSNGGAARDYQWADSVTIDSNTVIGAYSGIIVSNTLAAANPLYNRGYKIRGNNIVNAYNVGIDFTYVYNAGEISYNTIRMNPANTLNFGINSDGNQVTTPGTHTSYIGNNIIATLYGIYVSTFASPPGDRLTIYNNIATSSYSTFGLGSTAYFTGAGEVEVYHNTFTATHAATPYCFYYSSSVTGTSYFKNNIVSVTAAAVYPAYFATNPGVSNEVNYNNYYNAAGGVLLNRNGISYNAATYRTISAGGDSSYSVSPPFVSASDLHLTNGCTRGVDLTPIVQKDIDGTTRSSSPVIGAHESGGFANDIAIASVTYATPIDTGLQNLTVKVKNNAVASVVSMNINYKLNNGSVVTYPWTGILSGCNDTAIVLTGSYKINIPTGSHLLMVYLSSPNGSIDNNTSNDTLKMAVSTITAKAGNAYYGAGVSNSKFVRIPHVASVNPTTAFTAEAWVKLTNSNTTQKLFAKSTARTNGFSLGVQFGGLYPEIWTAAGGAATPVTGFTGNIPNNTWTHIAITWESGVGLKGYINGEYTGSVLSTTSTTMIPSTSDLIIGMNSWDNTQNTLGAIDEVRLWNVALDSLTLRKNMHRTLRRTEPGLISYIQLNELGSSTMVCDPISGASGTVVGTGTLTASTIPAGGDSTLAISAASVGAFVNSSVTVDLADGFDNPCDLTITEIPLAPNALPAVANKLSDRYWIIQPFGATGNFIANLTFQLPAGYLNTTDPQLALYKRPYNDTAAWTLYKAATSILANTVTFSGVDTFGQFTIASAGTSPLPVTLLRFSGKKTGKGTMLNWQTANEVNSKSFEIERSFNGDEFEKTGTVKASGKTSIVTSYQFLDAKADFSNTLYYRLKQIDLDGRYKYSPVVTIHPDLISAGRLNVFPNPFNNDLAVTFTTETATSATLSLIDITGKTIATYLHETKAGSNELNIDANKIHAGIYFLSVEVNGEKRVTKVIKQ
jgi:hypothetical protein